MAKQYADPGTYEAKLEKVMSRLGVDKFDYDWSRFECWVSFTYKGQPYQFLHSVENAKAHGVNIRYGSDVFAQVVLSLEDLARMVERGIYDLSTWVAGMKYLPGAVDIPDCFRILQFETMPNGLWEVDKHYKQLVKALHPDVGGTDEQFCTLQNAYAAATKYFERVSAR